MFEPDIDTDGATADPSGDDGVTYPTTFLPGAPLLPQDLPLLLFPGIFVVHFRSVVLLAASPRPSLRALWGRIPWQASVAFVALFSPLAALGLERIVVRELVSRPTEAGEILGSAFSHYHHGHGAGWLAVWVLGVATAVRTMFRHVLHVPELLEPAAAAHRHCPAPAAK